jgi:hypothetical protein
MDDFFQLFKVDGHGQMTILKGGVDGFNYFSLISVILLNIMHML